MGLDISTTTIGWCLLNNDGSFCDIGYVDLKKNKDEYSKFVVVKRFLEENQNIIKKARIYIEAPLMMFKMKSSMASTISKLQRWNGMVCGLIYNLFENFDIKLNLISVISARKSVGLTFPRKKKKADIKPMVFDYVKSLNVIPESHWIYKKTGKVKDYHYDECDAFVIARAAYLLLDEKEDCKEGKN